MTPAGGPTTHDVTRLLRAWGAGDRDAGEAVLDRIYGALRKTAGSALRRERHDHSLQPTELVHETFLRLLKQRSVSWESRQHFLAIASKLIRRILIDHARRRGRAKRGADWSPVTVDRVELEVVAPVPGLGALDDALTRLGQLDARKVAVVRLHAIAGLSVAETATRLECSVSTVVRDWRFTRKWLATQLDGGEG